MEGSAQRPRGAHGLRYGQAGVRGQGDALSAVARRLTPTLRNARVLTRFGHYAAVVQLADDLALALCTDGVGTKTIVASLLERFDTIGADCIAMNVNDLICVGARPVALVDYIGVHSLDERRIDELLKGLAAAADEAGIAIPGGELAQLPEIVGSEGDDGAFDLVGSSIGTLHPSELVLGDDIRPGDALIGIASSGIHSNGLTLARRALLDESGHDLLEHVAALGRSLGDELLEPTAIYVRAVLDLWDGGISTRGLAHITGDGLMNLCRLNPTVGYVLEDLPERPAIFDLIQKAGRVTDEEMFRVFNMGIGFVVVVPGEESQAALGSISDSGHRAQRIGVVSDEPGVVRIEPAGLVGTLPSGDGRLVRSASE
ncbi:MAG: phosphoribosylformylglycinamidine cyclo-ligase [Actinomycetota bacterium]